MQDILPGEAWENFFPEQLRVSLQSAANLVTAINRANGWFDDSRTIGDECSLLHSEVSELLEEFRDHGLQSGWDNQIQVDLFSGEEGIIHKFVPLAVGETYPPGQKPLGVASEAADILIRLLDFCDRNGINLAEETIAKLRYNETRGYKHGGKAL